MISKDISKEIKVIDLSCCSISKKKLELCMES